MTVGSSLNSLHGPAPLNPQSYRTTEHFSLPNGESARVTAWFLVESWSAGARPHLSSLRSSSSQRSSRERNRPQLASGPRPSVSPLLSCPARTRVPLSNAAFACPPFDQCSSTVPRRCLQACTLLSAVRLTPASHNPLVRRLLPLPGTGHRPARGLIRRFRYGTALFLPCAWACVLVITPAIALLHYSTCAGAWSNSKLEKAVRSAGLSLPLSFWPSLYSLNMWCDAWSVSLRAYCLVPVPNSSWISGCWIELIGRVW
jgi:hypothetical protein